MCNTIIDPISERWGKWGSCSEKRGDLPRITQICKWQRKIPWQVFWIQIPSSFSLPEKKMVLQNSCKPVPGNRLWWDTERERGRSSHAFMSILPTYNHAGRRNRMKPKYSCFLGLTSLGPVRILLFPSASQQNGILSV